MNHLNILKRAFSITWSYRVLWVFGFLLALTTARNGGSNNSVQFSGNDFNRGQPFRDFFPGISPEVGNAILAGVIALICALFLLAIIATIMRYVSETALIRLVDLNEASGEQVSVRTGFRMGWSRQAFRLFLIDLLVGIVGIIAFLLILAIAAAPLLVWLTDSEPLHVLGTIAAVGLIFLAILVFIAAVIVLSIVMNFIRRAAVLENQGVIESIGRGFDLVRQRLGDIAIMAVIMFAIGLAWVVLSIPIFIVLILAAVVLGGLPALLAGLLTSLFAQDAWPWIVGGLVGLPIFLLVLIVPGGFVSGLYRTFVSSVWTLTYREALALGPASLVSPEPLPGAPRAEVEAGELESGEDGLDTNFTEDTDEI